MPIGPPGFLRRALTQHLELKFLALIIGLVIFYSREREESGERTLQVDLMMIGQESAGDLVRVSALPAKIEIAVRGPVGAVAALRAEQVGPVAIAVEEAVAQGRIDLRRGMFNLPDGVRLLWASPSAIEFRFEKRLVKTVPVVPKLGPTDPDTAVDPEGATVEPPQVTLTGPESAVAPIAEISTATVSLDGQGPGTFVENVRFLVPEDGRVSVSAERGRVRVGLLPDIVESERTGVPVMVVKGTDFEPFGTLTYGATGLRASVRVRGLRRVLEALGNDEIRLFARAVRGAFVDVDGNGVAEAVVPIEAEKRSDLWSVVAIEPGVLEMTWTPPPPPEPPPLPPGGPIEGTADPAAAPVPGRPWTP
ncbi:MAG: hypothetical protein HY907_16840 [Deltaproteobacteria bacterium]|nr:hypothetical protein [Deltaproteobacteria bacterium]